MSKVCPFLGKPCIEQSCKFYNESLEDCELQGIALNIYSIRESLKEK